jgi:MtN3 and saliva related transmembrane protein
MWITFIETAFFIALVANAAVFIPQAIKLYRTKSSREVSFATFLAFNIIQLLTAAHAYLANDILLLVGSILSFITCAIVTYLAFLYRNHL